MDMDMDMLDLLADASSERLDEMEIAHVNYCDAFSKTRFCTEPGIKGDRDLPLSHRLLRIFTMENAGVSMKLSHRKNCATSWNVSIHFYGVGFQPDFEEYVTFECIKDFDFGNLGCLKYCDEDGYHYGGFYCPGDNEHVEPIFEFYLDDDGNLVRREQGRGQRRDLKRTMVASFALKMIRLKDFFQPLPYRCPYRYKICLKLSPRTRDLIRNGKRRLEGKRLDVQIKEYRNTLRCLGLGWTTVAGSRLPSDVVHKIAEMHLKDGKDETFRSKQTLDVLKGKKVITHSLLPNEFRYDSPSLSPYVGFIKARAKYGEFNTRNYEVKTPHGVYWPSRGCSPGGKGGVAYRWNKKSTKRKI